jgi:hypothetical protein
LTRDELDHAGEFPRTWVNHRTVPELIERAEKIFIKLHIPLPRPREFKAPQLPSNCCGSDLARFTPPDLWHEVADRAPWREWSRTAETRKIKPYPENLEAAGHDEPLLSACPYLVRRDPICAKIQDTRRALFCLTYYDRNLSPDRLNQKDLDIIMPWINSQSVPALLKEASAFFINADIPLPRPDEFKLPEFQARPKAAYPAQAPVFQKFGARAFRLEDELAMERRVSYAISMLGQARLSLETPCKTLPVADLDLTHLELVNRFWIDEIRFRGLTEDVWRCLNQSGIIER